MKAEHQAVLVFPQHFVLLLAFQTEPHSTLKQLPNMIFDNLTKKQRPLELPFLSHMTSLFTVGAAARSFCINTEKHQGAPSQ